MREFGVKVLVSALLVAVLSDALPCGRDNSPINEVVTTPETTSSSPTTEFATTPDTTSSSPTTEVATTPDTTSSSPTTRTIPSKCGTRDSISSNQGLYLTPDLPYFSAMDCCYAYGLVPFIIRKGNKLDRRKLTTRVYNYGDIWHPMNDTQNKGTFVFPDGTIVNDDNDALFVRNRTKNNGYKDCVILERSAFLDDFWILKSILQLIDTDCDFYSQGVCIDKDEFKGAHWVTYDDMYIDQEDYGNIFFPNGMNDEDEYFEMLAKP